MRQTQETEHSPERGRNRHDRFQVGCQTCGFLAGYANLADALAHAREATTRHTFKSEVISVFDTMAHRGQPDLWSATGSVLAVRPLGG